MRKTINKVNLDFNLNKLSNILKNISIIKHLTNISINKNNYLYFTIIFLKIIIQILLYQSYFMLLNYLTNILNFNTFYLFSFIFISFNLIKARIIPIIKLNNKDYNFIYCFRLNETIYTHNLIYNFFYNSLFMLLSILLTIGYHNFNIIEIIILYLLYLSSYFIIEYLKVKKYTKKEIKIIDPIFKYILNLFYLEVLIGIIYIIKPYLYEIPNILFITVYIVLGITSFLELFYYDKYREFYKRNLSLELINSRNLYIKEELESTNKEITNNTLETTLKNYEYLNYIYINNFKNNLKTRKKFKRNILIIFSLLAFIFKNLGYVEMYCYISFILMIILSESKRYILLWFYEIDKYLLNFKKYKTIENIKETYKVRFNELKKANKYNYLIASIFSSIAFYLIYKNILISLVLPISIIIFGYLYDSICLSLYYLFVPFDDNGKTQNKIYSLIINLLLAICSIPPYCIFLDIKILKDYYLIYYLILLILMIIINKILKYLIDKYGEVRFKKYGNN